MRKIKEVLRLYHEVHLGQREIARCAQLAQSTVHEYLAAGAGGRFRLAVARRPGRAGHREPAVPARCAGRDSPTPFPIIADIDEELRTHSNLTLQLLWEEYRQAHADGCCYSRFCVLYRRWRKKQAVVLRQEHKPGEKLFVDWAGATVPDP